jgi:hypothetical protein
MITYAFPQSKPSQSTYKALHTPWCQFISGLWRVSLAEYIPVLRVLFPHVAGSKAYYCGDKLAFSPTSGGEWTMGMVPSYIVSICCCWTWLCVGTVIQLSVGKGWFQAISLQLLLFEVGFALSLCCTPMYLWTWCNMWTVVTESCTILVISLKKFKIPRDFTDYRVYMGSSMQI